MSNEPRSRWWMIINSSSVDVDYIAPSVCNLRIVPNSNILAVVKHRHSAVRGGERKYGRRLGELFKNVHLHKLPRTPAYSTYN